MSDIRHESSLEPGSRRKVVAISRFKSSRSPNFFTYVLELAGRLCHLLDA
ncbi:hypothetical protein [Sinorhizobium fredii]|nr:hypothetical protein [Sinorhizobium fredii]AWM29352.1 hypothetical protein AOX55_00006577 [Sinorhizobium fredii CCBAU 25509]